MVDGSADNVTVADADVSADGGAGHVDESARERSAIAFPYVPLHDVIEMVEKLEGRGYSCRVEELAADLGQQRTSGAFRSRVSAGRMFGVTETVRGDVTLTDLGRQILSPEAQAKALVTAFANVPLYAAIYDKFASGKLPPDSGIEAEMIRLGVPRKQVQKARQVMIRSAETAGYFRAGRDRLIKPPVGSVANGYGDAPAPDKPVVPPAEVVSMAEHPLIKGLVAKLPPEGGRFTSKQRQRWLEAAKLNLELIYADDDDEPASNASSLNGLATAQLQPS